MTQPTARPAAALKAASAAMDATFHASRQAHVIACNAWEAHKTNAMTYADACVVQAQSDAVHEAHRRACEKFRDADDADWQWVKHHCQA